MWSPRDVHASTAGGVFKGRDQAGERGAASGGTKMRGTCLVSAGWLGETGGTLQGNQFDWEVDCVDAEDGWSCFFVQNCWDDHPSTFLGKAKTKKPTTPRAEKNPTRNIKGKEE